MSKNKTEPVEEADGFEIGHEQAAEVVEVPEPAPQPPTEQQRLAEFRRMVREASERTLCEMFAYLDVRPVGSGTDEGLFKAHLGERALPLPTEPS